MRSNSLRSAAKPNPSFEPTRYGRQRKPGLRYSVHSLSGLTLPASARGSTQTLGLALHRLCILSEQKLLLRTAEIIAMAAVMTALYFGVKTHQELDPDFPVFLAGIAGMAVLMVTFLPACMLGGEYVKTVRMPTTWRQRTAGLDKKELTAVLRWAPRFHLLVAGIGILVLVVATIKYGSVQFNSSQAPDPTKTPALFFYFSVFYALALPVLASASRMPGSYASHSEA